MADSDYRAWVEVLPSFNGFNAAVESTVVAGMVPASRQGSAALGGGLVAGVGKFALPLVGAIAALGIATAITDQVKAGFDAAVSYVQSSADLAAELEQNVGAVSAVFKENAAQIEAWSEGSAEALGLSRNSYLQFSALVGSQLKNLNVPFDEVAGQTNNLITLGADLAAQFGGTTSDAVLALSSLLRGERDPIERYGVTIKQADINARVAAMGLGELTLEEERQAQILATLAILNEQTADAQGTFSRESGTFLNVQQQMNAVLENTATELGEQLLPVLTEVMQFVKDDLVPIWQEFNAEVGPALRESLERVWPQLQELAERLLPLIPPALDAIITALEMFANVAVETLDRVDILVGGFADFFALLRGDVSFEQFVVNFGARLIEWKDSVNTTIAGVVGAFANLGGSILSEVELIATNLYNSGRALVQKLIDGIVSKVSDVANAAKDIVSTIADYFPHSPAKRGPFSGAGWGAVADAGRAIMDQFASGLVPVDVPLGFSSGLSLPSAGPRVVRPVEVSGGVEPVVVQVVNKAGVALSEFVDMRIQQNSVWQSVDVDGGVRR